MAIGSGTELMDVVLANMGVESATEATQVKWWLGVRRHILVVKELADALAADTLALPICVIPVQFRVISATYRPQSALTAHDTNYATLSLEYDDGAGGSDTIVASQTTKITGGSGNWTAAVGVPLTLTTANVVVAASKQLIFKKAVAASGVILGAGTLDIVIEPA